MLNKLGENSCFSVSLVQISAAELCLFYVDLISAVGLSLKSTVNIISGVNESKQRLRLLLLHLFVFSLRINQ